ncbi:ferrous iron transporter B [Desulfofalx alkaliphila]|uniref:ferrous iron transporter B n=1 Tax=Desulfofalx alkaliphila TaxID=105483 RepID=UPI0004E20886|nr:ferrous iron transporter B [Desulfofalx alkaliphila]
MSCHDTKKNNLQTDGKLNFLLMGNPNVGKSVVFSKLTGKEVLSSNYAGTTITTMQGKIFRHGEEAVLVDVPGTYSLTATSPVEEVAVDILNQGADAVICVLDATNLERNLNFALQILEHGLPTVFALNLIDVAERQGIYIDVNKLEEELGAPVVPTVAIRNVGLAQLLDRAWQLAKDKPVRDKLMPTDQDKRWQHVGRIIEKVQRVEHRHATFWEKLGDLTLQPFPGLPIAFLVLLLSMAVVVGGGKALRSFILLPIIYDWYVPLITPIVSQFVAEGMLHNILLGEYGVLIKGIEWPFGLILPYVFLFYIALSILEDSGFLPRLGVLVDGVMRRVGIQGGNIVPFIMGYGCAVPAILGTRAVTSYKERLIVSGTVCFAVPCVSQTGAFISLLGDHSIGLLILMFGISFGAIFLAGLVLNKVLPGNIDPIMIEIPNLLKPDRQALKRKIWLRTKQFMLEAEIPIILAILLAAVLVETGLLVYISDFIGPLVIGWLGLPAEASLALMLGIVRRELGVLPLLEMDLSTLQLLVGSVVALFYIPCLSVFAVLTKEFGIKVASALSLTTIIAAFLFGGLINHSVSIISTLF